MAHKLRDKIIDEKLLGELKDKAVADRDALRKSVEILRSNGYKVTSVEDIEAISVDRCKEVVQQGREAYLQRVTGFYFPQSMVDSALKNFQEAEEKCCNEAAKIVDILAQYPRVLHKLDSKGNFWFDEKTLSAFLEEKATLPFDEVDKRLYELLGQICDDLNALRKYEKEADIVGFSIRDPWENMPYIQDAFRDFSEKRNMFGVLERTDTWSIDPKRYLDLKKWHFVNYKNQQFRDAEKRAREDYEKYRRPVQ